MQNFKEMVLTHPSNRIFFNNASVHKDLERVFDAQKHEIRIKSQPDARYAPHWTTWAVDGQGRIGNVKSSTL